MSVVTAVPSPAGVPVEALQLYEKLRPQLAGVNMAVFVEQFWNKGLQAQLQKSISTRAANPYPEASRLEDKLRLHYEAQVRAALSGVAELLQNKPHTKCDSLMQKGDVIKDAVESRCAAFGRHSDPIQTLQTLGISNPAHYHQRLCAQIAQRIGDLWPAYYAKKQFQYNNSEKFVAHFAKRLVASGVPATGTLPVAGMIPEALTRQPPGLGDRVVPLAAAVREPPVLSPAAAKTPARSGLTQVSAVHEPIALVGALNESPEASLSSSFEESSDSGLATPPLSNTVGMDRIGMQPIAYDMPGLVDIPRADGSQSISALPPRPPLVSLPQEHAALPPRPALITLQGQATTASALPPRPGLIAREPVASSPASVAATLPPRPALIPLHGGLVGTASGPTAAAPSGLRPLSADHPLAQKLMMAQNIVAAAAAPATSPTISVAMKLLQKYLDSDAALSLPGNSFVFFAPSDAKMQAQGAADLAAISNNAEATKLFTMCHLCPDASPTSTVTNRQWKPLHSAAAPIIVGSTLQMVQPGVEAPRLAVQSLYMHAGKNIAVRIFSHDNIILPG